MSVKGASDMIITLLRSPPGRRSDRTVAVFILKFWELFFRKPLGLFFEDRVEDAQELAHARGDDDLEGLPGFLEALGELL
jgi:hypothetical protein